MREVESLSSLGTAGPLGYKCACGGMILLEKVTVQTLVAPSGQNDPICAKYHWTCTGCDAKIPKDQTEE